MPRGQKNITNNSSTVVEKSESATSRFIGSGLLNTLNLQNNYSAANFHITSLKI